LFSSTFNFRPSADDHVSARPCSKSNVKWPSNQPQIAYSELPYCWPTGLDFEFPRTTLSPTTHALELYEQSGKMQMLDVDEESYPASVNSDYLTLEQEAAGLIVGSPCKKARSVKEKFKEMHISDESPTSRKRPALLHKVTMALPKPLQLATNPSTPPQSTVSLPNLPLNSVFMRTPTHQRSLNDPSLTSTPYSRAHKTGRKYLCARCIDLGLLRCWISYNTRQLQAAHLVPRCLEKPLYRQHLESLRGAIGGRLSVNSRVNYFLRKLSSAHSLIHLIPSSSASANSYLIR